MVKIEDLHVGDTVMIVQEPPIFEANWNPYMDVYCGRVMTVLEIFDGNHIRMEEDQDDEFAKDCGQDGWYWGINMIECFAEEWEPGNFEDPSDAML